MIEKISKMISNLKVLSKMNDIIDGLNTHTTNTNNPHNVTAEQLGLATAYVYKGSVENFSELPTDAQNGWVYSVENEYIDSSGNVHPAGSNFAWNGSRWDDLGGSLSRYTTLDFLEDRLAPITNQVNTNKTNIEDLQNDVDTLNMETIPTAVNKAETAATNAQNAATHAEVQAESVKKYKALWFDSVAAMKAEPSLTTGAYVNTAGYYEPNDGGGASYLIRTKDESDVDDSGSLHELANGLVAELIVENGTVNVKQFGAVGNGVADDTVAIQNAINTKYKTLMPEGSYLITSDIDIPSRTYIKGKGELSRLVFTNASLSMVGTSVINGGSHKRDLILENIYLFQSSKYTSKPCILLECTTYIKFYDVFIMSPRAIIFKEVFDSTFDSCSFEWWGSTSDDSAAGVEFVQGVSDYGTYENTNCMLFSRCRWESGYQNAIKITGSDLYGQTHDITFETCHFETVRAGGKVLNLERCYLNFDNCEFACNDDIPNYFMYVNKSQLINVKNCSFGYIQGSGDVSTYSPFYITLQRNGGVFNLWFHDTKRKSFASYKDFITTYQNTFFISGDICISYIEPTGSVEKWDNNYEKIKLLQDKHIGETAGWFSGTAGEEVTKQFTIQLSRYHGKLVEITIGDYNNAAIPTYNGLFYIPANGNEYVYSTLKPPIKELNVFNNSVASGSHKFNNVSVSIDYAESLIQTLTVKFTPVDTSTSLQVNVNVTEL